MNVLGQDLPPTLCQKCGAKFYPESLLEPHLMRHDRIDEILKTNNERFLTLGETINKGRRRPKRRVLSKWQKSYQRQ